MPEHLGLVKRLGTSIEQSKYLRLGGNTPYFVVFPTPLLAFSGTVGNQLAIRTFLAFLDVGLDLVAVWIPTRCEWCGTVPCPDRLTKRPHYFSLVTDLL